MPLQIISIFRRRDLNAKFWVYRYENIFASHFAIGKTRLNLTLFWRKYRETWYLEHFIIIMFGMLQSWKPLPIISFLPSITSTSNSLLVNPKNFNNLFFHSQNFFYYWVSNQGYRSLRPSLWPLYYTVPILRHSLNFSHYKLHLLPSIALLDYTFIQENRFSVGS